MTQNTEKRPNIDHSSQRGQYDAVSKKLIQDNPEDWLRQCVKVASSVPQNEQHQADYLQGYLVFGFSCPFFTNAKCPKPHLPAWD